MAEHPFSAYLARQPEPQRATLETVAASLRRLLPGAVEAISYAMPAFVVDGTAIAGIAGFKHHCSYFPHSGSVLERLRSEDLANYEHDSGTLRFPIDRPLPASLLRKLVVARLQLESEHAPRAGKVRTFYDNGFLRSKGGRRDGEMHGQWSFYRKDGTLMRTGRFDTGRQIGVWTTYDRAGAVVTERSLGQRPVLG